MTDTLSPTGATGPARSGGDQAAPGLLERDAELAQVAGLVDRVAGGASAVAVIEGQAGVGKTELLRAAGELGAAAGLRVLRARGSDLDRAFAFGVVRQLFEREVAAAPALLTGGAEPAAAVFSPTADGERADTGLFASLQALHWLVANLGAERPVLLLADDVHWADTASLRALVFLAERVEDLPLLLVAATRPAEPGADQDLLDALTMAPDAAVLRPAPLSASAATAVVRDRLPEAADAFGEACHRATGGNPFLLGELLGELAADGVVGAAGEAGKVLEFGSERVGRAVRRRLRLLPREAAAVARTVAVLGPCASLADAARVAGIDEATAATAADALVGIHVLAAGRALDFIHPVVRSAVYDQIPPLECQRLHADAAELLMARGACSEEVARHLLRLPASGAPERAAVLRAAGREAAAGGATEAASRYLRRALDEPPAEEERGAILHELGLVEAADRQRDRFDRTLRAALAVTRDPERRARIALDLGRALAGCGDFQASTDALSAGLRELGEPDAPLGVALEAELIGMTFHELATTGFGRARLDRRLAQLDAGEPLDPSTRAPLVVALAAARGPATAAIELAEGVILEGRFDDPHAVSPGSLANALIYAGAPSRAGRLYDEWIARATRSGSRMCVAWQSVMRSDVSLRLGDVRRAEAEARLGMAVADEGIGPGGLSWSLAAAVNALVARGALDEADALLDEGLAKLGPAPSLPLAFLLTASAQLHLARGRARDALRDARAAGDLVAGRIRNPECVRWRSPAALALAALDRGEEAREMAERELEEARGFGVPDAEGVALRTLGLVIGGGAGVEALRAAVAAHERGEGRLEHARSTLELGSALRRAGERAEAREVLREALDATARAGASALADRAHEELVAAGARPRRDRRMLSGREALTAGEDRVAVLAAEGLTNREIAQRQFVTVKAVQWHLRNVYRKLGVGSREELPSALGLAERPQVVGHAA